MDTVETPSTTLRDTSGAETIEIILPDGSRVRVGKAVSLTVLRRVLAAIAPRSGRYQCTC